jgi:predicted metalloprotease with PDZ domain
MHFRLSKVLFVTILAAAAALYAQEQKKCSSSAQECEQQIRHFLAGRRYLGLELVDLKPGMVVKTVVLESPADRAGFEKDDRIIGVNGHAMTQASVRDFKQIMTGASGNSRLWVIVQRRGAFRKIEVRLEPYTKAQIDKIVAAHLAQYHSAGVAEK